MQTDIDEINQKFNSLISDIGLEPSEYPTNQQLNNPPTPSFLQRNTPAITCLDTTSCDEDVLLQKMLQGPLVSINSLSSESIYEDSAMTLIIDNNSNYIPSPKPVSPTNLVPNIDQPEPSSSDISNASNGSSGYPRSTESESSDDNQCVPDIDDRQEELLSRLHYYGDFTVDRQTKINNMTARLTNTPVIYHNNTAADTEELFTREVIGCESEYIPPGFAPPPRSSTRSTSSNCSSPSPRHHRVKRISRAQRNRTSSSQGSRRSISIPQASSTMIEDFSPSSQSSGSSKHRTSSIPRASSTMIEDPTSSSCRPHSSTDDMDSVYCWSIKEGSEELPLEESYYRNINRISSKPPLPTKKVLPSSCGTSLVETTCNDTLSMIVPATQQQDLVTDSLYEEVTFYNKAKTLPRTSTRTDLNGNKSSGSSMEARRASMPDMVSVLTSENDNVQSVPNSSASTHSSSLDDRPAIPGKSSSSGSHTSPPNSNETHNTQAMIDSLLTDSPHSYSSTGVFAPNNSPYSSRASPVSETEIQCMPPAPPSSVRSTSPKENQLFKKPKGIIPLWKLFRFRRKPKSTENIASTPQRRPSSIHSEPVTKKKLFMTPSPEVHLMDKRAVAKKLRRFSESFRQKDTTQIHTLANL